MSGGKWSEFAKQTQAQKEKRKAATGANAAKPEAAKSSNAVVATAPSGPRRGNSSLLPSRFIRKVETLAPVVPISLENFHWHEVVLGQKRPGGGEFPPMIQLKNPTQGPMCIELKGGGTIPVTIGLQRQNNNEKLRFSFQVDKLEERKALLRIHEEIVSALMLFGKEWYPQWPEFPNPAENVSRLISEVKAKPDGSGEYAPLASVNINERDLIPKDENHEAELIIMAEGGTKQVTDVSTIMGQRWEYMVWELQFLVLGMHKEKGYPLVSVSRRLRRLHIAIDENSFHVVFPEDKDHHDANECKRKHTLPHLLSTFSLKEHAKILNLVPKDKCSTARIESKLGGDLIIILRGGGTLPFFVLDVNQQGNLNFSFAIESADEEKKLDAVVEELRDYVVEHRAIYFPKSELPDQLLRFCVKRILGKPSDKPQYADFARNMSCIIDEDQIGMGVRIVDGLGQDIREPSKEALVGKRWQEAWVALRSVYKQTKGELFEVSFSKRLLYLKLARDMSDYSLAVAPPPPPPATDPQQADAKRQRTS